MQTEKWEYLTLTCYGMVADLELNQLGRQGWLLVTCLAQEGQIICIFRRPATSLDGK